MLEDSSGIEQSFGLSTDFAGAMFMPSCIEEMAESENYADARFSENDFCPAKSVVSKKASLAYYVDKESVITDWQDKCETEVALDRSFVKALQNQLCMDASTDMISSNTCTKYPLSSTSSTSESPTGTLTPLEHQNELWQAIGSLDIFLVDKDIIEACETSNADQSGSDDNLLGTTAVSLAEFLLRYKQLTDWLKQVHEITHRDVTCLSEKYLNLACHEEMLEQSPRRQFLHDYASQLLLRCPKVADEVNDKMATLNSQWESLEQAINARSDTCNPEAIQKDLQTDMTTLRHWLTEVEAALLPLAIKDDWTPAELEEQLKEHQVLQQDIESHNRIVNAVLQLSQQFDDSAHGLGRDGVSYSFHLVAFNLQRRWHGVWLQSLEWQCRLEEGISRRRSCCKSGLDFCIRSLPVVNESSLSNSSSSSDIHNLLEVDDEDFLFISHPDNATNSARLHTEFQHAGFTQIIVDGHKPSTSVFHDALSRDYVNFKVQTTNDYDDLSVSLKTGDSLSTTSALRESENPSVASAALAQGRSHAKEKLCNFSTDRERSQSFSVSEPRGHVVGPVESFSSIKCINNSDVFQESLVTKEDYDHTCLTLGKLLFDLSSGDSANISESESKMGDFPPFNGLAGEPENLGGPLATSSEGEGEPLAEENINTLEVKDIGYSTDSLSNDEDDVLRHQIGIECKFPGKCEVASDGPLGDKVSLPSVATRPEYYFMTLVDIDSTDKTDNGDTTDSAGEKLKKYTGHYRIKSSMDAPKLELLKNVTDNGDTTDSAGEKMKKYTGHYRIKSSMDAPKLELLKNVTDNGDTTDSAGEKMKKYTGHYRIKSSMDAPKLELLKNVTGEDRSKHTTDKYSHSLDGSWAVLDFAATSSSESYFEETKALHGNTYEFPLENENFSPTRELLDSDNVVEPEVKNSIKYLIDHAEDLVKYPSPRKQQPKSPSKQTQTDPHSTVESSCDASAEDNSEFETHLKNNLVKDDLSTATDDADETLFNSMINVHSVDESLRSEDFDQTILASPYSPVIHDSPHLRTQTCRRRYQRGETRPWSVVGLDNINLSKKFPDHTHRISAVSESAINHLHFQTNDDLPSWLLMSSQSMPPFGKTRSQRTHRASTSCDQTSPQLESSALHTPHPTCKETTFSTSYKENTLNLDASHASLSQPVLKAPVPYCDKSSEASVPKTSSRHSRCKVSHETRHSSARCSWTSDVFDSAESEPETESSDEYQTAPLELATSEGDDILNVSGSLSESSAWDNYQMLYPTASEDQGEELMTWEPQDDLEFDDDFLLKHQKELLTRNGMIGTHKHTELRVSQQNLLGQDSDSELEDFHDILDQSELAQKKAEQSLGKMRNQPGSPVHVNSIKYDVIKTYETNMGCLKSICQHLKSENVPENDVKRVQALMGQWEELHDLATEYQTHAKFLSDVADFMVEVQTHIQEVENCVPFDGLTTAGELKEVMTLLEERKTTLKQHEQQLNTAYKQLMEFSALHPMKHAERYSQELLDIQKAITAAITTVSDHEERQTELLEYFERQHRLNVSLTSDREKLHKLLCQQQYRMHINKKDMLKELEILRNNLSLHESELSLLQSMWPRLATNSEPSAQSLRASVGDLRNQLLVMSQRCCQIDCDMEDDDDDTLVAQQSDLGKLAMYSTALHEAARRPKNSLTRSSSLENLPGTSSTNRKFGHSCAFWLCSLPAQVVALMLVTGLICALDPDLLDHLSSLTLKISPELRYVSGPPAT